MSLRERMASLRDELDAEVGRAGRPVALMEVCGTHTVSACRSGVHSLVPDGVRLVSGPGCPVCVTPQSAIDALIELGRRPEVTLATYGDMLRVTGAGGSLELARSDGADVRVVTSSMEAVEIARTEPDREVVFAAVGFETTAPATAVAVLAAKEEGLPNFSIVSCHKRVMPAMRALVADPEIAIDGFLCPGHVSVILGADAYAPLVAEHGKPCVVAGFEALRIMEGIVHLVRQVADGKPRLENLYPEVVRDGANPHALALLEEVFEPADTPWRALGTIPESGWVLREEYAEFDAVRRFDVRPGEDREPPGCRCGEVITGRVEPADCPLFGRTCTPLEPVGPCMVSSEGTCRAWFRYRRREAKRA